MKKILLGCMCALGIGMLAAGCGVGGEDKAAKMKACETDATALDHADKCKACCTAAGANQHGYTNWPGKPAKCWCLL